MDNIITSTIPSGIAHLKTIDPTATIGTALATCTAWKHFWNGSSVTMETYPVHDPSLSHIGDAEYVWQINLKSAVYPTHDFAPAGTLADGAPRLAPIMVFPVDGVADIQRRGWFVSDVWGGRD